MSLSYKDIFEVHIKYVDFLTSKTKLIHQYTNNISATGNEVEVELRKFLSDFIPNRYKITHGYICRTEDNIQEPIISPQLDCIIVDTLVPHSLYPLSFSTGMEVVPYECVVGIIEIKRTLSKEYLFKALDHLKKTRDTLKIDKTNQANYLPGGLKSETLTTGIFSNPLLAILSIDHDTSLSDYNNNTPEYQELSKYFNDIQIDLIGSLSGLVFCTAEKVEASVNFKINSYREKDKEYEYLFATNEIFNSSGLISRILGFIIAYLSLTSGQHESMTKYFFHRSTFLKLDSPPK